MPFSNPIMGGQNFERPVMSSPNFSISAGTGWAIYKNGDAYFYSIILPGSAVGTTVIFSSTEPASPTTGEIWYDTGDGLAASVWNGTEWVSYSIGTGAIASEAITTALIADGAVGTAQIASEAVTSALLAAGTALANIGSAGLTAAYLADGAALANLSAASITASLLAAGAALSNVGSGGITSEYIAADAIVAGAIAADAVTAGTIAAGAVTATQIASGTITATQLAVGIVVAGIVNGTLIEGAQFVAYGNTGEVLVYSGTPATGNLIGSWSAEAGSDGHGNDYDAGLTITNGAGQGFNLNGTTLTLLGSQTYATGGIGNANVYAAPASATDGQSGVYFIGPTDYQVQAVLQLLGESNDQSLGAIASFFSYNAATDVISGLGIALTNLDDDPAGVSAGARFYSLGGYFKFASGDGNAYDTGRRSLITTESTTTTSTTPIPITGLSCPVAAGTYRLHGLIWVDMGATGTEMRLGISGPTASGVLLSWKNFVVSENAATSVEGSYLMTSVTNILLGPALGASTNYAVEVDGWITFSESGTLEFVIGEQTSGDTMIASAGSFMDVMPVA